MHALEQKALGQIIRYLAAAHNHHVFHAAAEQIDLFEKGLQFIMGRNQINPVPRLQHVAAAGDENLLSALYRDVYKRQGMYS